MRACLVRDLARRPKRSAFLEDYEKHHGTAEAKKLADEVRAEIEHARTSGGLFGG